MMIRRLLLLLAILGMTAFHPALTPAYAADGSVALTTSEFSKNNPDIRKYEFARSYITALSYMKDIYDRSDKHTPEQLFPHDKNKMILATLNDLALDDSDLRIIKNYLLKYLISPNMLMRKVADIVVVATNREIYINGQEKTLWQKWYNLSAAGQATAAKEKLFVKDRHSLELRRKDADKDIIQASVMMTRVLISAQNKNGKGYILAVTAQQRQKLLDKLDSFGSDTLDWGLKPGQTTLEASIAVIREMLEDSLWTSIDEQ